MHLHPSSRKTLYFQHDTFSKSPLSKPLSKVSVFISVFDEFSVGNRQKRIKMCVLNENVCTETGRLSVGSNELESGGQLKEKKLKKATWFKTFLVSTSMQVFSCFHCFQLWFSNLQILKSVQTSARTMNKIWVITVVINSRLTIESTTYF